MQIAIATSQGTDVDRHFGNTDRFFIYEISDDLPAFSKVIEVTPYSTGDTSHQFDRQRFDMIYSRLQGCKKIYCTKIGERPKEELRKRGIDAIECNCTIEAITI